VHEDLRDRFDTGFDYNGTQTLKNIGAATRLAKSHNNVRANDPL